jgi:hypothetical protein
MSITTWHAPAQFVPSASRHGERSAAPLYSAAGRASSEWEQIEEALVKLFQILCETSSEATCKAYCTISGAPGRTPPWPQPSRCMKEPCLAERIRGGRHLSQQHRPRRPGRAGWTSN